MKTDDGSILYIDASSGVSGDMLLAAFLDLGFPDNELYSLLDELHLPKETISFKKIKRGIYKPLLLEYKSNLVLKNYNQIKDFINTSSLDIKFKKRVLKIINFFFKREAEIHKEFFDKLHIDELSNIDFIIEICGVLKAIDYFSPEKIYCSPINIGFGQINSSHGKLLIPSPLTTQLLKEVPVFSSGTNFELTTPTGALLIKHIVDEYGSFPPSILKKIGLGAGTFETPGNINILQLFLCQIKNNVLEKIAVLETNVDNVSGEILGYLTNKLMKEGAYDVFYEPIFMKKGRPAYKISVLCSLELIQKLAEIIFKETHTLGIRYWQCDRIKLKRKVAKVKTNYGSVRVKIAYLGNQVITMNPEYEDCKRIATKHKLPIKEIYQEALNQIKSSDQWRRNIR